MIYIITISIQRKCVRCSKSRMSNYCSQNQYSLCPSFALMHTWQRRFIKHTRAFSVTCGVLFQILANIGPPTFPVHFVKVVSFHPIVRNRSKRQVMVVHWYSAVPGSPSQHVQHVPGCYPAEMWWHISEFE